MIEMTNMALLDHNRKHILRHQTVKPKLKTWKFFLIYTLILADQYKTKNHISYFAEAKNHILLVAT